MFQLWLQRYSRQIGAKHYSFHTDLAEYSDGIFLSEAAPGNHRQLVRSRKPLRCVKVDIGVLLRQFYPFIPPGRANMCQYNG